MTTVQPFYITGLPRSRTSWLSVALADWRVSACLSYPLARMESFDPASVIAVLEATKCLRAGISDPGLPLVAPELPVLLPGPVLIVWRDPGEVIDSLTAYLGGDRDAHAGGVALMQERLVDFSRQMMKHQGALEVNFEDLRQEHAMRAIWQHLLPGVPFQRRRIEALQRLRIEPDRAQLLEGRDGLRAGSVQELGAVIASASTTTRTFP